MRAHRMSDLDDAAKMWSDPDVVRHIGGRPFTRDEVWHRLLRYLGHWEMLGYGYWAVEERRTGQFVGEMGFADWKRPSLSHYPGVPECGWVLVPAAQGRGLASEGLRAIVDWGDVHLRRSTICIITPENQASIKLAERVGFLPAENPASADASSLTFERLPA